MDADLGVMLRVSAEVENALPEFCKGLRGSECLELYQLADESWRDGDWSALFHYVDRISVYVRDYRYARDVDNLDKLTTLARRLWLLATTEAVIKDKDRSELPYDTDVLVDLEHIGRLWKPTLHKRVKALEGLLEIAECVDWSTPTVWEIESERYHEEVAKRLDFIRVEVLVHLFEDSLVRTDASISEKRRKGWITALVNIATFMRNVWLFREEMGYKVINHFLGSDCNIDMRSNEIFFKFRMVLLMCPNSTCYQLLVKGDLFKWWFLVDENSVNSWSSMMSSFLLRAVKFAWATGKPYMIEEVTSKIPYIFQHIYSALKIPNIANVTYFKESVPGEFTAYLEKPLNFIKKLGKIVAYLVAPVVEEMEIEQKNVAETMDYLTALVNVVYPYTHPSNGGKWSLNIASFIRSFVVGYSRRVCRERSPKAVASEKMGMVIDGKLMKLNRETDAAIVELFYALALQGMYSKNMHLAYSCEDVIKRLCNLQPDTILVGVLDHLMLSCESVTEPHQVLSALRLFAQLFPLIVKYTPQAISTLLDISLKGINSADPFKTGQTLTLINVIFSHLPCKDLRDLEISDKEKLEIVKAIYTKESDEMIVTSGDSFHNPQDQLIDVKSGVIQVCTDMKTSEELDGAFSGDMVILHNTKNIDDAISALDRILDQRRMITENFSFWCQEWFGTMLQLAENSSKPNSGTDSLMNAVDMGTYILSRSALVTVLSQTDEHTFANICETYVRWVKENVFRPDSLKYMTALASCLSYSNPKMTMDLVFDKLFLQFQREVKSCTEELGEKQVVWYNSCFGSLVRRANVDILPRLSQIEYILKIGFSHKSKNGFKYAAKLLQRSVDSLLGVYFTDCRCSTNFREEMNPGLILWDLPWFLRDAKFRDGQCDISGIRDVQWHISNKEEVEGAMRLCIYSVSVIVNMVSGIIHLPLPKTMESSMAVDITLDSSLTPYMRMNRAYILAKNLLRSMKNFAVDERDMHTNGLPTVSPFEIPEVKEFQRFVLDLILSTMSTFGSIDSTNDLAVTKIYHKMLKVVEEYLCRTAQQGEDDQHSDGSSLVSSIRQAAILGTSITASKSMLHWTSFYCGVRSSTYWQDAPRATWLLAVHDRYYRRLSARKGHHECKGERQTLLNFVLDCATCQYKDLSGYAQNILKPIAYLHRNVYARMAEYLLDRGIHMYPQSASDNSSALECLACIPETMKTPIIKKIAVKSYLFNKFCKLICGVVSTAPNKDSLMNKYDKMLLSLLNSREYLLPTEKTAEALGLLLNTLLEKQHTAAQGVTHWRFQLYATAILVCFRNTIPQEMLGKYALWLMEASDHTSKQSCVVAVALFGLSHIFGNEAAWNYLPPEALEPPFAKVLLNSIHSVNHDSIKQDNSSTVKQSNSIVISVIKLDRTWPRNRSCSNSKGFSIQNFLVVYHYFRYLLHNGRMATVECTSSILEDLASNPPTSLEYHCAFAEISSAIMKASIYASPEERAHIWGFLQPIMKRELESVVTESIYDFMDGMRLAIEDVDSNSEACIPVLNLSINYRAPLSLTSLHVLDVTAADNTSLGVVKQLKLYQALLQQITTENKDMFEILCNAVFNEAAIFNDSLQVVEAIGLVCSYVISLCCAFGNSHNVKGRIQEYIALLIKKVDETLEEEQQNESAIKGLMLMVKSFYSSSVPTLDLSHKYTSTFLEFCLKFTGDSNQNLSEISTKAVKQIVMSRFHSRGNIEAVHAIVDTVERTSKLPSTKIKSTSINAVTMMQRHICMYLRKTDVMDRLVRLYIWALQEKHIWDVGRDGLTALTISASDQLHFELTQKFYDMIKAGNGTLANAGVFGLAALVSTAPYHVPNWMPNTLTTLASCASSRFPDVVRKSVQETLQDFFKSHMDAWSQVHVHKFTREQLDVLEIHKGCPVYFN